MLQIELNAVRHLVADLACLNNDFDLRLMLSTKRILKALTVSSDLSCMEMKHPIIGF